MAVTAALIKELRERTGAGMMDCKKILVETGGDIELAIEELRKRGAADAEKKSGRIAAEGIIASAHNDDASVLLEVNCETDFVAKDDSFRAFAGDAARQALEQGPADVAALETVAFERRGFNSHKYPRPSNRRIQLLAWPLKPLLQSELGSVCLGVCGDTGGCAGPK